MYTLNSHHMALLGRFQMMCLLAAYALSLHQPVCAAGERAVPSIMLRAYSHEQLRHPRTLPLMLEVVIFNQSGRGVALENERAQILRQAYAEKGLLDTMDDSKRQAFLERAQDKEVTSFSLGSPQQSVSELIRFVVAGGSGTQKSLPVRPLASSPTEKESVLIDADRSLYLLFGIDPESLSVLGEGDYTVAAILDSQGKSGMWTGRVESNKVTLSILDHNSGTGGKESIDELYLAGRYYLADNQFGRAEQYARDILSIDPDSIYGWELRGDAFLSEHKLDQAENAYLRGIDIYKSKTIKAWENLPDRESVEVEDPLYLQEGLSIVRLMKSANRQSHK